jgi:hypothetical protein
MHYQRAYGYTQTLYQANNGQVRCSHTFATADAGGKLDVRELWFERSAQISSLRYH